MAVERLNISAYVGPRPESGTMPPDGAHFAELVYSGSDFRIALVVIDSWLLYNRHIRITVAVSVVDPGYERLGIVLQIEKGADADSIVWRPPGTRARWDALLPQEPAA